MLICLSVSQSLSFIFLSLSILHFLFKNSFLCFQSLFLSVQFTICSFSVCLPFLFVFLICQLSFFCFCFLIFCANHKSPSKSDPSFGRIFKKKEIFRNFCFCFKFHQVFCSLQTVLLISSLYFSRAAKTISGIVLFISSLYLFRAVKKKSYRIFGQINYRLDRPLRLTSKPYLG